MEINDPHFPKVFSEELGKTTKLWALLYDDIYKKYNLSYSRFVIITNVGHNGKMKLKGLANILVISSSAITELVDKMVKDGVLKKNRSRKDRRVVMVSLTEKGKQLFNSFHSEIIPIAVKKTKKIFSSFSEDELSKLLSLLIKLNDSLEEEIFKDKH